MDVLIVDDSNEFRKRLAMTLSKIGGVCVSEAKDANSSYDRLNDLHPDMVIIDIRLPDRSGIEILEHVKMILPETKVLMLTNYPYQEYISKCILAGADYYLIKYRDMEKVVEIVRDYQCRSARE